MSEPVCTDCGVECSACACPHAWDGSKGYYYRDSGYTVRWNVPCSRCGSERSVVAMDAPKNVPVVSGVYFPWNGKSSCGQVRYDGYLGALRSAQQALEEEARRERIRAQYKDGGFYWALDLPRNAGPNKARTPFVLRFHAQEARFLVMPMIGEWEEIPSFRPEDVEIVCPCPVPDAVLEVVAVETVLLT